MCSSCKQRDQLKKMTAPLRSLVLLQPLWMQLMYYLAESVIRTRRIRLLVRHNMGCCHSSRTAVVKADYKGMKVIVGTRATKCDAVRQFPKEIQMLFQDKFH